VGDDPMSSGLIPSSENSDRCAIKKGSSISLLKIYPHSGPTHRMEMTDTYGMMEFPKRSRTMSWTTIGGASGRRDSVADPNSAVLCGCCTTSSSYVLVYGVSISAEDAETDADTLSESR